jgi:hypothetical protein
MVVSSFSIQFDNGYLLMGELRPLTFTENIERYVAITAI